MKFIVENLEQTKKLAIDFAKKISGKEIILLNGELGAGKTTFTKFLLAELGVSEMVTSPTFTFLKEYVGKNFAIYHYDLYRAEDADELFELGLTENFGQGLCVIEWNKFSSFPSNPITINIKYLGDSSREFEFLY